MASVTNWILSQNPDYVYPLGVNLFVSLLPAWMAVKVGGARKRTGLRYPLEYHPGVVDEKTDSAKYLFNCTQRAAMVTSPTTSRHAHEPPYPALQFTAFEIHLGFSGIGGLTGRTSMRAFRRS